MNTAVTGPAAKKDRITTVSLTVLCQSFQALSMGGIALLLPMIRQDLGLSFTQGGTLAAATTLVYAFMQIPAGYLADRFSPKRLFIIGIFGATVLSLTFGLVDNYWQALGNQVLSGFFRALLFVPGMSLVTGWFPANRRATATGLYLVGGATGSLVFNLAGPLVVNEYGWRVAFIGFASAGLLAIFFLLRFGKDSPLSSSQKKEGLLESFKLFRYRVMWVCGGIQFIRLAVMMGITYWLPSLLIEEKGLSLQTAGVIAAVQAVLMAPSNILGGYVSDRLNNPIIVIAVSLGVLCVSTGILITATNIAVVIALVFINAIFLQMYFGPLFSIPVEILGVKKAGISSGFSNFFANLGGFSATFLLGAMKDTTGAFRAGFLVICGACLAGLILTFVLGWIRCKSGINGDSNVR
ncbi:MAG: MFS transporter [Dehalococcoidales bacterium]|nr:MFS transporter [Dehalococcoidales bacterium]